MIKVIVASLKISLKKIKEYRFESLMLLVHCIFNLLFLILFWYSISSNFVLPFGYTEKDMFLYSGLIMFSNAINDIFFCVNVLPYSINDGELDMYLIKPKYRTLLYVLDNINVVSVLEGIIVSIVYLIIVVNKFGFDVGLLLLSLLFVVIGTFDFALILGIVSLSSFWLGMIDNLQNILYSFNDFQKYPLGIFDKNIRKFFIYILPIGLISYFPLEIVLKRADISLSIITLYVIVTIVLLFLFLLLKQIGVKKYESNN